MDGIDNHWTKFIFENALSVAVGESKSPSTTIKDRMNNGINNDWTKFVFENALSVAV